MSDNHHIEINEAVLMSYINAELPPAHMAEVEHWLLLSDDNRAQFDQLKKTWDISGQISPEPVAVNTDMAWQNVLGQIQTDDTKIIPINRFKSRIRYVIGIAAVFVLLFTAYQFWDTDPTSQSVVLASNNKIVTKTLSDGSEITVNKTSTLTYPENFEGDERRVKLKGEAFFDIERDTEKAFIIELPEASYVKVLGTSFNINTDDDNSTITVFVNTGKVEFGAVDADPIILLPGEKGILNKTTNEVYKEIEEINEIKSQIWRKEEFTFESTELENVIETMNMIFEEQVEFECEEAKNLPIRTSFKIEDSVAIILERIMFYHSSKIAITPEETDKGGTIYKISCQ